MSDYEYAVMVYNAVFSGGNENDCHIKGVLSVLSDLTPREQAVLEYRYREGFTYKKIGEMLGLKSSTRPYQIIQKILRKLRHSSHGCKMSISAIVRECNDYKDRLAKSVLETRQAHLEIIRLKKCIESIEENLPTGFLHFVDKGDLTARTPLTVVEDLNLSVRSFNCIKRASYNTIDDILKIESASEFQKIRNLGKKSMLEILEVMRNSGFVEWAERIETTKSAENIPILRE